MNKYIYILCLKFIENRQFIDQQINNQLMVLLFLSLFSLLFVFASVIIAVIFAIIGINVNEVRGIIQAGIAIDGICCWWLQKCTHYWLLFIS